MTNTTSFYLLLQKVGYQPEIQKTLFYKTQKIQVLMLTICFAKKAAIFTVSSVVNFNLSNKIKPN